MKDARVKMTITLTSQESLTFQEFATIQDAIDWLEKLRTLIQAAKNQS